MNIPENLDSVIKLNETHLTTLSDLHTALTTALRKLKYIDDTDGSGKKYVILKDLQNEDKGWYLIYDLISHAINHEEMDDDYFTKRAAGNLVTFHDVLSRSILLQ